MAVQKSKVTRSRRGMRRSHDSLGSAALAEDKETGEIHRRHHITPDGFYRGEQIIEPKQKANNEEDSE